MPCQKCRQFPVPTSNYALLNIDVPGHAELYRCRSCGRLIKMVAEERAGAQFFDDFYVSREHRFALGKESTSGRFYLSIPVSNRLVDYEEYYEITKDEAETFVSNVELAKAFADKCRRRAMDDTLIIEPGNDRGTAV